MEYVGEEFTGLRLEGGEVNGILFEDCLFTDCRLEGVALRGCRFTGCHFRGCRLGGLKADNVQAMGNSFEGCVVLGLDWSALLDPRKQDLGFLPFDSFARCDLAGSFFEGCRLSGADFSGCPLRGASFSHCDLTGADFRRAQEYSFSTEGNQVKGAKFSMPEAVGLLYGLGLQIEEG